MNEAAHGTLHKLEGRSALRFERTLSHPVEHVWKALTERGELKRWHPTPFELDPVDGGSVRFALEIEAGAGDERLSSDDLPAMRDGVVTEFDPPHVLAHTWGDDHLRWELHPVERGCLLTLIHTFDDRFKAARDGAGWHLCLDGLESVLAGRPASGSEGVIPAGWPELNRMYEERFGIAPEEATPPPDTGAR